MSSLNQVMLIGNLGKDPEVLQVSELGSFVKLSLATHKKFKTRNGEEREDTQWHTVYLNNRIGRIAAVSLKKGAKIFISGELRTHDWQDKAGNVYRTSAIYAREMKFLSHKSHENEVLDFSDEDNVYEKAKQEIDKTLGRLPADAT